MSFRRPKGLSRPENFRGGEKKPISLCLELCLQGERPSLVIKDQYPNLIEVIKYGHWQIMHIAPFRAGELSHTRERYSKG